MNIPVATIEAKSKGRSPNLRRKQLENKASIQSLPKISNKENKNLGN